MKLKTNDTVVIIAGKDKGKKGKIIRLLVAKNQIVVEKVNIRTRHMKKTASAAGEIVKYEAPISASNAQILDPKSGKPTRIAYKTIAGQKTRIAVSSGEPLTNEKGTK